MDGFLTRRNVRHELVRRRNERIAETRDDRWPVAIYMHQDSIDDLLMDGDAEQRDTIDFEGREFMNVPLISDNRLEHGVVSLQWPSDAKEAVDG